MFNKNLLKAKMVELGVSHEKLSNLLGLNSATLYRKMNGISDFSRSEMQIIRSVLMLSADDADAIFFAPQLTETQATT